MNTKTNKKGFTLIELIVVMAILGVLVLIAAPRFLGYTKKADVKRIQNDTKVVEQLTEEYLMVHEDLTGWDSIDAETLNSYLSKDELYETKGVAEAVAEGSYSLVPSAISGVSKLDGSFYANTMGKVYYIGAEASQGVPAVVIPVETSPFIFDGINTITGYEPFGPKDVVIPSEIDGKIVTIIGNGAFKENNIDSVMIPSSVTTIGDEAFVMNNLNSINIPENVIYIGAASFGGNQLTSVVIPDSVTFIGGSAFMGNQLSNITISTGLTVMAFDGSFNEIYIMGGCTPGNYILDGGVWTK